MLHQILGDEADAFLRADDGLQCRPLGLELFLVLQFLAFGRLLEIRVNLRPFLRLQLQFGQAAFVVNRHRRLVLNRALDVVNADVIAEHRPRVGIGLFNGRAGEADERGVRQRIAHVPGKAVNEIVLAAVRLVRDDHDVPPFGKQRVLAALFLREKLLNRREHHAAAGHLQQFLQMLAALRLHRFLSQQFVAAGERAEKLVVQIVAVREHNERRILHRRFQHQPPGVERHRERLARTLRVPDHANAPVTRSRRQVVSWRNSRRLLFNSIADAERARIVSSTAIFTAWNW